MATGCAVDSRLAARIVDDASGQPLAARVAATHPDGKPLEVDGRHEHVQYLGKRWCYVDGSFTLAVPAAGAVVEIRRGLETLPLSETIAAARSDATRRGRSGSAASRTCTATDS